MNIVLYGCLIYKMQRARLGAIKAEIKFYFSSFVKNIRIDRKLFVSVQVFSLYLFNSIVLILCNEA